MAKYAERRYVVHREEADPSRLYDTVRSRDLTSLLQLYAEGADLSKPFVLPDGQVKDETKIPLYFSWHETCKTALWWTWIILEEIWCLFLSFPSSSHHIFPCLCSFPFLISSSVFHHSTILSLYLPTLWLCWLDHVFSCVYLFALVVFGLLFQLLGQSSSLWRTSETGSLNYAGNSHKHALFAVQKQIFGCAVSQMKLPSMYPDETNRAQLVHFLPVEGNQRDGSPPCCASGRKEFTGTGRFPLSEQVRLCTSSHIDAHLVQKAGTHHHLYVHITATVWRREQQKETQHFTTASFITSQSL